MRFFLLWVISSLFFLGCVSAVDQETANTDEAIKDPSISRVDSESVEITWQADASVDEVKILWRAGNVAPASCDSSDPSVTVSASLSTYVIESLTPGVEYSFRICFKFADEEDFSTTIGDTITESSGSGSGSDGSGSDSSGSGSDGSSGGDGTGSGSDGSGSGGVATVSITSSPTMSASNIHEYTVSGNCSDDGMDVTVAISGTSHSQVDSCSGGTFSVQFEATDLSNASYTVTADHSDATQDTESITNSFSCPSDYVAVPADGTYTNSSFCLAKFEMKDVAGTATVQAASAPWNSISQGDAITECTDIGGSYDLMTNDQWQTVAQNIERNTTNWSSGAIGTGQLNKGVVGRFFGFGFAASTNDNEGCTGTDAGIGACDLATWHEERRTHELSNGLIIWDIGGNLSEWVKETHSFNDGANTAGPNAFISNVTSTTHSLSVTFTGGSTARTVRDHFGSYFNYSGGAGSDYNLSTSPYAGMGHIYTYTWNGTRTGIIRGGRENDSAEDSGIFLTELDANTSSSYVRVGFRCQYQP